MCSRGLLSEGETHPILELLSKRIGLADVKEDSWLNEESISWIRDDSTVMTFPKSMFECMSELAAFSGLAKGPRGEYFKKTVLGVGNMFAESSPLVSSVPLSSFAIQVTETPGFAGVREWRPRWVQIGLDCACGDKVVMKATPTSVVIKGFGVRHVLPGLSGLPCLSVVQVAVVCDVAVFLLLIPPQSRRGYWRTLVKNVPMSGGWAPACPVCSLQVAGVKLIHAWEDVIKP